MSSASLPIIPLYYFFLSLSLSPACGGSDGFCFATCQTHKDSVAIVCLLCVSISEWESAHHYKQQDVTMQFPEWPSHSLPLFLFGLQPTREHLETLNLIKASTSSSFFFFFCSCGRSPSEVVAGRLDWTHSTHMQHPKKVWTEACEKPISLWVSPLMIRTCGLSEEQRRYS